MPLHNLRLVCRKEMKSNQMQRLGVNFSGGQLSKLQHHLKSKLLAGSSGLRTDGKAHSTNCPLLHREQLEQLWKTTHTSFDRLAERCMTKWPIMICLITPGSVVSEMKQGKLSSHQACTLEERMELRPDQTHQLSKLAL